MPNVLLVASDGLLTRGGSITAGLDRFMPWRPEGGGQPTLEALIRDPALRRRFGDAGQARVRTEFALEANFERLAARFGLGPANEDRLLRTA